MRAAEAAVKKALALDDTLAEAHASAGWVKAFYHLDWAGAEAEYRRSIQLNPKYATAHHWYALHLTLVGRTEEAIAEAEVAHELDPLSLMIGTALGTVLYLARQYDRAVEVLKGVLEMDPSFVPAGAWLAAAYLEKGMTQETLDIVANLAISVPDKPKHIAGLACVYARTGDKKKAEELLGQLTAMAKETYVPPYNVAQVYACLDRKAEAFEFLGMVLEEKFGILLLKLDPLFDGLRSDPRFTELLRRANLAG
jgi:tetratricopeptide (TPR) repeat protein